ncbi:MAG: flagellar biosynthesis protein FlhF [Calditrichia bacterium]
MKIKKYTGKTFQEAFEKVKAELGEDAVILNSRKMKDGGMLDFINSKEYYEITAAVDQQKPKKQAGLAAQRAQLAYNAQAAAARAGVTYKAPAPAVETQAPPQPVMAPEMEEKILEQTQEIRALHGEIRDIKQVLNQVSDFLKYSRMPALPENFKSILKMLVDNEVHEDLAKAVVQTVYAQTNQKDYGNKDVVIQNLNALLGRMIKIGPALETVKRKPYVVALVGPTGVGKTTTVAKLAANLKLYNQSKVALISADTYRIAAIEQLQTFANIATIPMSVVYSPEDMRDAIYKYRDYDVVLIDTVGRSQKNEQHLRELNQFIEMANPDEVHLVLSMTTGLKNLLDIVRRFKLMRPNRFIFTKLDETSNTGNILNLLYKHHIPVSYLTTGQVVPNDITTASKESLTNLIVKGVIN